MLLDMKMNTGLDLKRFIYASRNFVLNMDKLESNAFNLTSSCNSNCQCSPSYVERKFNLI